MTANFSKEEQQRALSFLQLHRSRWFRDFSLMGVISFVMPLGAGPKISTATIEMFTQNVDSFGIDHGMACAWMSMVTGFLIAAVTNYTRIKLTYRNIKKDLPDRCLIAYMRKYRQNVSSLRSKPRVEKVVPKRR